MKTIKADSLDDYPPMAELPSGGYCDCGYCEYCQRAADEAMAQAELIKAEGASFFDPMPVVKVDSLEIVEGCNGYYLYGETLDNETVCLGCLGDGSDGAPSLDDMPIWEWSEVYHFNLTD